MIKVERQGAKQEKPKSLEEEVAEQQTRIEFLEATIDDMILNSNSGGGL